MKTVISKLFAVLSVLAGAGLMIYGALVHFIRTENPTSNVITDGLGRELELAPLFVRRLLGWAELWPGFWLFLLDTLLLFILMALMFLFANLASTDNQEK